MYELMRPAMRSWYAMKMGESGVVPKPRDSTIMRSDAPNGDNVLLLGNGPTQGWGVTTHQLALAGQLRRGIESLTSRPCTVSYVGDETMNMQSAVSWLGDEDISVYDVITVVIGMNDAVRLTSVKVWEQNLRCLLQTLTERGKADARIIVAGIQPVRSVTAWDESLGKVADHHRKKLNKTSKDLVSDFPQAEYWPLPAPELETDRPHGSSRVYRAWGSGIAARVTPALESVRNREEARIVTPVPEPEWEWSGAPRLVELASTGGSAELQRLAALAQEQFEVDVAVVSLLDGDRLWYAMNTEQLPVSIPRDVAYCNIVVRDTAPLVVPDARVDARFRGNPFIEVTGKIFYAGHPLVSTTGRTIGTFCLLNSTPKAPESISLDLLRDMALQAQTEIWKYEQPGPLLTADTLPTESRGIHTH